MRLFTPILALLLLPAGAAAQSTPPAAQPVPESVFQKFLSVLPDADRAEGASRKADPAEVAALAALNPGKAARVQAILDAYEGCIGPANDRAVDRMFRHVAGQLGEAKIRALTAFYESPDLDRVGALFGRIEAGETLPEPEQAEADRLLARYPLAEFRDAMLPAGQDLMNDMGFTEAMAACSTAREEALEKDGIRQQ